MICFLVKRLNGFDIDSSGCKKHYLPKLQAGRGQYAFVYKNGKAMFRFVKLFPLSGVSTLCFYCFLYAGFGQGQSWPFFMGESGKDAWGHDSAKGLA